MLKNTKIGKYKSECKKEQNKLKEKWMWMWKR